MSQVRKVYNALLESGELTTLYTSMKGDWNKDKKLFTKQYEANEELIRNISDIDLDEEGYFEEPY